MLPHAEKANPQCCQADAWLLWSQGPAPFSRLHILVACSFQSELEANLRGWSTVLAIKHPRTSASKNAGLEGLESCRQVAGHVSGAGIPCDVCGHVCYLAHALRNLSRDLCCLRCAQAAPQRQSGDTFVLCHRKLADYRQLAASFELELASGSIPESTLRMEGLTESQHWSPDPQGKKLFSPLLLLLAL